MITDEDGSSNSGFGVFFSPSWWYENPDEQLLAEKLGNYGRDQQGVHCVASQVTFKLGGLKQ